MFVNPRLPHRFHGHQSSTSLEVWPTKSKAWRREGQGKGKAKEVGAVGEVDEPPDQF